MCTCFKVENTQNVSPSAQTLHFSACLFNSPLPKNPVCSDWSALTGLSRHHPPCFCISSACFIATTAWGDTKPCRSPGGSFQRTVSEYQLYVFLSGLSILIFLFIYLLLYYYYYLFKLKAKQTQHFRQHGIIKA